MGLKRLIISNDGLRYSLLHYESNGSKAHCTLVLLFRTKLLSDRIILFGSIWQHVRPQLGSKRYNELIPSPLRATYLIMTGTPLEPKILS